VGSEMCIRQRAYDDHQYVENNIKSRSIGLLAYVIFLIFIHFVSSIYPSNDKRDWDNK